MALSLKLTPPTIRIIAFQILFFGLLFLPDYSSYHVTFERMDVSRVMYALAHFMNNPAFYGLLIVTAIIFSFSFQYRIEDVAQEDGIVSVGDMLIRSLARVLVLYIILFFVSWLFLTYKLMFMQDIYINDKVFSALTGQ